MIETRTYHSYIFNSALSNIIVFVFASKKLVLENGRWCVYREQRLWYFYIFKIFTTFSKSNAL